MEYGKRGNMGSFSALPKLILTVWPWAGEGLSPPKSACGRCCLYVSLLKTQLLREGMVAQAGIEIYPLQGGKVLASTSAPMNV